MYCSVTNFRAYWFPRTADSGRYITTSGHRYNVAKGLDIPDLSPFIDQQYTVEAMKVNIAHSNGTADEFAIYYTTHPIPSGSNRSLLAADPLVDWRGDVVVFRVRKSDNTCALVNMRRGDHLLALEAVRVCVILFSLPPDCALIEHPIVQSGRASFSRWLSYDTSRIFRFWLGP